MLELPFHAELYDRAAIDEAVKTYEPFAGLNVDAQPHVTIVRLEIAQAAVDDGIDEVTLAAELMNYALGKTIEIRSAADAAKAPEVAP